MQALAGRLVRDYTVFIRRSKTRSPLDMARCDVVGKFLQEWVWNGFESFCFSAKRERRESGNFFITKNCFQVFLIKRNWMFSLMKCFQLFPNGIFTCEMRFSRGRESERGESPVSSLNSSGSEKKNFSFPGRRENSMAALLFNRFNITRGCRFDEPSGCDDLTEWFKAFLDPENYSIVYVVSRDSSVKVRNSSKEKESFSNLIN